MVLYLLEDMHFAKNIIVDICITNGVIIVLSSIGLP